MNAANLSAVTVVRRLGRSPDQEGAAPAATFPTRQYSLMTAFASVLLVVLLAMVNTDAVSRDPAVPLALEKGK